MVLRRFRSDSDLPIGYVQRLTVRRQIKWLLFFFGFSHRLCQPRRFPRRLWRKQFLHEFVLSLVYVAVFAVEDELARLEFEVSAAIELLHERLVEQLQPRDVSGKPRVGISAAEVTGEVHLAVEDFGVD